MVAALCAWHEHHTRALAELDRRIDAGEHLVVAGPAVVETYAVLTRLPAPYRLSARDAAETLEDARTAQPSSAYGRLCRTSTSP
jgi:predicted nucleic acid-binding protein